MLSTSKIIIILMSASAVLLQNFLRWPGLVRFNRETMLWSDFTDSLLASLCHRIDLCSYRPLRIKLTFTAGQSGITVIETS